jgi:N-acyl-D-amino-acid deacylase
MSRYDTLILNANVVDGSGEIGPAFDPALDIGLYGGEIVDIGVSLSRSARHIIDAEGKILAPGFIDTHTHDDLSVVKTPEMLAKISQGVTTVIVGNCGISGAPARLNNGLPDPMNLLGSAEDYSYPTFGSYLSAIADAQPSVNVAALVGHTTLRNNHMDRLDRSATEQEISAMCEDLKDALRLGAIGLSTGLAYLSAYSASTEEVLALAQPLAEFNAIYATHLRSETEQIIGAMREASRVGSDTGVPVIISHLKCAGIANWGRSQEVLDALNAAQKHQSIAWDCYPYAAGSSTLDLRQVDERLQIMITWSEAYPGMAGKTLQEIAAIWNTDQIEAARRLMPAGAIYHSISEADVRNILKNPSTMIGSDGLPNDPRPHPRLWGTFPRVLGKYCRDEKLFTLSEAIYKMTGLPAQQFRLQKRGLVKVGFSADLVLFDPETIRDTATFSNSISVAEGITAVWVNGFLSYEPGKTMGKRAGKFLPHVNE